MQRKPLLSYSEPLRRLLKLAAQQWGSSPTAKNGCCTQPLVHKGSSCAPTLRKLCAADSPAQTRVMNYAFSPGSCKGGWCTTVLFSFLRPVSTF